MQNSLVVIRGGGDLATGVIQKFYRSGFRVVVLEAAQPTAIRRTVALCEAVYDGAAQVEDVPAVRTTPEGIADAHQKGKVPIIIDETANSIQVLQPDAVIDAILAKRNLGTRKDMAPVVVGLGPGFTAGQDCHAVVETMRGHNLGRVLFRGSALPNTGIPGVIGGKGADRVVRAPAGGTLQAAAQIGDVVQQGDTLFTVNGIPAAAPFTGLLRGLLREGLPVHKGMKSADVDPRIDTDWHTISDKARCIGGGALEAVLYLLNHKND